MRRPIVCTIVLLTTLPLFGSVLEVKTLDRHAGTVAIHASGASMHAFLRTVELRTGKRIIADFSDFRFRADLSGGTLMESFETIIRALDLRIVDQGDALLVRDARDLTVSLNVVDRSAGEIVRSLARQCAIRNVMMDQEIAVRGTFVFEDVSCSTAFRIVFDSLGLDGSLEPSSILVVERKR